MMLYILIYIKSTISPLTAGETGLLFDDSLDGPEVGGEVRTGEVVVRNPALAIGVIDYPPKGEKAINQLSA